MNRLSKIHYILSLMEDQVDEIINEESLEDLSAEEVVQLAFELSINQVFNLPKNYSSPLATVSKDQMQFVIDEEFQIPVWSEELLIGEDDET